MHEILDLVSGCLGFQRVFGRKRVDEINDFIALLLAQSAGVWLAGDLRVVAWADVPGVRVCAACFEGGL